MQTRRIQPAVSGSPCPSIPAHSTVEAARGRLAREGLDFVAVTAGGSGRLLGVVTPESARPGPCCVRRDGRCSVINHLEPAAVLPGEPAAAPLEAPVAA